MLFGFNFDKSKVICIWICILGGIALYVCGPTVMLAALGLEHWWGLDSGHTHERGRDSTSR